MNWLNYSLGVASAKGLELANVNGDLVCVLVYVSIFVLLAIVVTITDRM